MIPSCEANVICTPRLQAIGASSFYPHIFIPQEDIVGAYHLSIWTGILLVLAVGWLTLQNAVNCYQRLLSYWIIDSSNYDMEASEQSVIWQ